MAMMKGVLCGLTTSSILLFLGANDGNVVGAFTASATFVAKTTSASRLFAESEEATLSNKKTALIIQNKGGGHGELGYQLAIELCKRDDICNVTLLQDYDCDDSKEPFKSYPSDLMTIKDDDNEEESKIKIMMAPLFDERMPIDVVNLQGMLGGRDVRFDYVWDNASKGVEEGSLGKAVIDTASTKWNCQLLTYVSSAGAYQPTSTTTFPMNEETTPVKETAGQIQYETYAKAAMQTKNENDVANGVIDLDNLPEELPLGFCSFRPQYIYGPKSNKNDYIDWFLDRLVRKRPLLIPGDGSQMASLTNSQDVARLLGCVVDETEAATDEVIFNCGTQHLVSYTDVVLQCAEALGMDSKEALDLIVYYDGDALGKGSFPFRTSDFYVAPTKAMDKLNWKGAQTTLQEDLMGWYVESYKARGGPDREVSFAKDDALLEQIAANEG